ncbi:MAG: hypothetical protein M3036_07775, partial [Bifidobacteriales bacterium]|nr:hypothetical protein [Bifidobacteriales bacterium]
MKHYVISLARTPERLERFRRVNSHLPDITHAPGIDGQQVDRQNIIKAGMLTADCQFTAGAVGSGLTHIALWGAIAQSQE